MKTDKRDSQQIKGAIWFVSPDTIVYDALQLMTEKEAGAVLIIENGEIQKLLGHSSIIENMVYMGLDGMYFKPEKHQIFDFSRNLKILQSL